MVNRTTNQNVNVNVGAGYGQGGSSTRRCGACQGTGKADYPTGLIICSVCRGKGVVRA